MFKRISLAMAILVAVAACDGGTSEDPAVDLGPGGETPVEAVEQLIGFLEEGDFTAAAALAVPGQAALASLAEGAAVSEVATALRNGDGIVAANFWSGFAQSITDVLSAGLTVEGSTPVEALGVEFNVVDLVTASGGNRKLTTANVDGHRVDIFATFGSALADRMYSPLERLLSSPVDDAALVLSEMKKQIPSLNMAAESPEIGADAIQNILRLIELISRIS